MPTALVVCDLLMPVMDGYAFVRQLRADPALATTPVIFYTATWLEREARALAGGHPPRLACLSRLPAEILKIDRAFILTMLEDPNPVTLVSTMISLAHSLRMKVVAEGVETEEQARILRLLRCDQMQGDLTGRPVAFDPVQRAP